MEKQMKRNECKNREDEDMAGLKVVTLELEVIEGLMI